MCGSMLDIKSATAENRQGKKDRKKKPQDENIMSTAATHGGHKNTQKLECGPIQRASCPAEHRWRPLFNAAKFG